MEKPTRIKINTHEDIDASYDEQLTGPARAIGHELVSCYEADRLNPKKYLYAAGTLNLEGLGKIHYVACFTKATKDIEVWFSRSDALYQRAMEDAAKCDPADVVGFGQGGMVN